MTKTGHMERVAMLLMPPAPKMKRSTHECAYCLPLAWLACMAARCIPPFRYCRGGGLLLIMLALCFVPHYNVLSLAHTGWGLWRAGV